MNLLTLAINAILIENLILMKFLGICPFIGLSKRKRTAIGISFASIFVMTISSILSYFIYYKILVPYNMEYLKTIVFILVIATFVQLTEIIIKSISKTLVKTLGIYLPLLTTNCAILGVALISVNSDFNLLEVIIYSISSALGFMLVMYIFASLRERLDKSPIPKSFKGLPIAFVTAAILSMIFTQYIGA
ncbi:MAG: RnfABCDGE type electron transport complex subunit A [Bacilli bacterium]